MPMTSSSSSDIVSVSGLLSSASGETSSMQQLRSNETPLKSMQMGRSGVVPVPSRPRPPPPPPPATAAAAAESPSSDGSMVISLRTFLAGHLELAAVRRRRLLLPRCGPFLDDGSRRRVVASRLPDFVEIIFGR